MSRAADEFDRARHDLELQLRLLLRPLTPIEERAHRVVRLAERLVEGHGFDDTAEMLRFALDGREAENAESEALVDRLMKEHIEARKAQTEAASAEQSEAAK